jgi:N-acetylglucosaminyl-diphospho-decaprenol L-rhamnosyltransferase
MLPQARPAAVPPSISVVVPTCDPRTRLEPLVASLARQTAEFELVLVDNGSPRGGLDWIAERVDAVTVVRFEENVGYTRAVNAGAARAQGDVLVLLNDDCTCDPPFLGEIAAALDPAAGIVMAAGVLRDRHAPELIDTAGMELDGTLLVFDYLNGAPLDVLERSPRSPVGPSAAAAAFDRDAFRAAGGFDERIFAYWEDVDLVLRLRRMGGRCALAARALGVHHHSATLGAGSREKNRLMGFGRGYVLRKWGVATPRRLPAILARDVVICLGQAAIDRNVSGMRGRLAGYRATTRQFDYPSALLDRAGRAGVLPDLRRRLERRVRLRRRRRTSDVTRPRHVLLVSYLFPPSDVSAVRRVVAIRRALDELDIRTTVLTSAVSGVGADDVADGVIRAPDLRARVDGQHRVVAGLGTGAVTRTRRRWWTRAIVPDVTAVTWAPAAVRAALRLARRDRPDLVITTSPPESVHLVGLALSRRGVPWFADLRDGWTFEPPTLRPYATALDRALERHVVRRATRVTAVTEPIVRDLAARHRTGTVVQLSNGFDPEAVRASADERATLDPGRFSLVYTGSGGIDGKDPRPFLRALERVLSAAPELRERLEVVVAGSFTEDELAALRAPSLDGVVRVLGRVEHRRALGLQQAADGLLLITSVGVAQVATAKIYEYLAAGKPIFALAHENAAVELLERSGGHVMARPDDEAAIAAGLRAFVAQRVLRGEPYAAAPGWDVNAYSFPQIVARLLDLYAEIPARRRPQPPC